MQNDSTAISPTLCTYPICWIVVLSTLSSYAERLVGFFLVKKQKMKGKCVMFERDIICLPKSFLQHGNLIEAPRKRSARQMLAVNKQVGKIQLDSAMSQSEIFNEVRSVFHIPMQGNNDFKFKVLQSSGGESRNLVIPQLSPSYRWTASAFSGKNSKTPIYILALDDLKVSLF